MAGRTVWSREIAAYLERIPMHAVPVLVELIGGDSVLRHLLAIGVAVGAGLGQAERINRRRRIFYRADIVNTVTVDAGCHVLVARGQPLAMDAGLIQLVLIHALLRPGFSHEGRSAVRSEDHT